MSEGPASTIDPDLARAIAGLAVPGLLIGHRVIQPGDADALLAQERATIASPVIQRQRASGAARMVARSLLAPFGHGGAPIIKDVSGAPIWPGGIVGSLAHDDRVAVAAVGQASTISAVGIDVEPADVLPPDMLALVVTPDEWKSLAGDPLRGRMLFAVKEAVYKAVFPLDRRFLEFQHINVDLPRQKAVTRHGRIVDVRYCASSHIVALALI